MSTWTCGEIQPNDQMIVPGTHFYKTISSMAWLRPLYAGQEKGYFDLYHVGGEVGGAVVGLLRWLHSGLLPMYVTWVMIGLVLVLLVVCGSGEGGMAIFYILLLFMVIAAIIAVETKDLLSSVICVGAIGFGGSLMFLFLHAPDIAITQIVVEVLGLIILILRDDLA